MIAHPALGKITASPSDITVRLYVVGKNVNINEYELDDAAKTNISLAAFSDSPVKAVALKNNEEVSTRKRSRASRHNKNRSKHRRLCCCCWICF